MLYEALLINRTQPDTRLEINLTALPVEAQTAHCS